MISKSTSAALIAGILSISPALADRAVTSTGLNMRAGPGTGQPVTHVLRARQAVEVLDCATPRWCRVQSAGSTGWVNRKYLRAAPEAPRSTLSTMSASKGTHPRGTLSTRALRRSTGLTVIGATGTSRSDVAASIQGAEISGALGANRYRVDPQGAVTVFMTRNAKGPVLSPGTLDFNPRSRGVIFYRADAASLSYLLVDGAPRVLERGKRYRVLINF